MTRNLSENAAFQRSDASGKSGIWSVKPGVDISALTRTRSVIPASSRRSTTTSVTHQPPPLSQEVQRETQDYANDDQDIRLAFLRILSEFPAIWRMSHRLYFDQGVKNRAWATILDDLKVDFGDDQLMAHKISSVADLQRIYETLRAGLRRVQAAHKKSTGMAAAEVREITWPYYEAMSFLRQHSEPLATDSSLDRSTTAQRPKPSAAQRPNPSASTGASTSAASLDEVAPVSTPASPDEHQDEADERSPSEAKWDSSKARKNRLRENEKRKLTRHSEAVSTHQAVRECLETLKDSANDKEERRAKRRHVDDEDSAFFSFMATQSRQVVMFSPHCSKSANVVFHIIVFIIPHHVIFRSGY